MEKEKESAFDPWVYKLYYHFWGFVFLNLIYKTFIK